MTPRTSRRRLGFLGLAIALVAAACGGGVSGADGDNSTGQAPETPVAEEAPLDGVSFTVGSKDFGEQLALGQIVIALLEARGADVTDKTNLKGTVNTRTALLSGEIDMYWEYTGTGWIILLGNTEPVSGAEAQWDAVAAQDLEENGIFWSTPLELDNTYAIAVRQDRADDLGISRLSDLATLETSELTFCTESEFSTRDDGLPGLFEMYELDVPGGNLVMLEGAMIYTETGKGEVCNFGEVFSTSGNLEELGLTILEDDRGFFPAYQPSLTMSAELAEQHPELDEIAQELAPLLTTDEIRLLNARIEVDGEDPATVVHEWLTDQGLI